jgi:hypothetical protein
MINTAIRLSVSLPVNLITAPSAPNGHEPSVRDRLGLRVIHSFLFTTIMSSLWDFRKFHNKQDSIFNLYCFNSNNKSIFKYLEFY